MAGRWPDADAATRTLILNARRERDQAVSDAEGQLLDLINERVGEGSITISAAAGVVGISRAPLSRALNARGATGRRGGGRTGPASAETRRELLAASEQRDQAVALAESLFIDTIAAAIEDQRITISAAAEILELHRNTLNAALARRTAQQ